MKNFMLSLFACFIVNGTNGQLLTPDQMVTDLSVITKSLELKHPQMYHYTKEEEFERLFDKVEESFTHQLSIKEFYSKIFPLIVALRCDHTKWLVPGKNQYYSFDERDLFPLSLYNMCFLEFRES